MRERQNTLNPRNCLASSSLICLLLILALFPMPYGYYTFMRLAICIYFTISILKIHKRCPVQVVISIGIILLYQPIIKCHFDKEIWNIINLSTIAVIILLYFTNLKISNSSPISASDRLIEQLKKIESVNERFSSHSYFLSEIANSCILEIKNNKDQWNQLLALDELDTPGKELIASVLVVNLKADKLLSTGQYHVYRGLLNHQGESIYEIYKITAKMILNAGVWTQNKYDDYTSDLHRHIKLIG